VLPLVFLEPVALEILEETETTLEDRMDREDQDLPTMGLEDMVAAMEVMGETLADPEGPLEDQAMVDPILEGSVLVDLAPVDLPEEEDLLHLMEEEIQQPLPQGIRPHGL
jgi:hypothetical protein